MYAKVVTILALVGMASSAISGVGKCKPGVTGVSDFDFDAFFTENGGKWNYKLVPDTDANANIKAMRLQSIAKGDGTYHSLVYEKKGDEEETAKSNQIRTYAGSGHVTATGVKTGYKFDYYYLAYKPDKYACYYMCSDEGGSSTDTVIVLSNLQGALSPDVKSEVDNIVASNNFKVVFKEL